MSDLEQVPPPHINVMDPAFMDVPSALKVRLFAFFNLCRDLNAMVKRENDILMADIPVVFDSFFYRKLTLMHSFERDLPDLVSDLKQSAPNNLRIQMILADEIRAVKHSLSINTAFHMEDLKVRTVRLNSLREQIIDRVNNDDTATEKDTVCH